MVANNPTAKLNEIQH